MDGIANHYRPKWTRLHDFAYKISKFSRGDTPGPAQKRPGCLDPDTNFRLACQRSHCSCFTKWPLCVVLSPTDFSTTNYCVYTFVGLSVCPLDRVWRLQLDKMTHHRRWLYANPIRTLTDTLEANTWWLVSRTFGNTAKSIARLTAHMPHSGGSALFSVRRTWHLRRTCVIFRL